MKTNPKLYEEGLKIRREVLGAAYVDPQIERITVLTRKGKNYGVHGEFSPGQAASSVVQPSFAVDVSAVFAAGKRLD